MPFVAAAQPAPPALTQPVNDFAHVIDPDSAAKMDELIRSLQRASGDVVVVTTIDTFMPYGDIREYATKMFENGGRGIGQKGKDNGLLILLAVKDRQVWVEVGYDLEEFITDGYAGELSRKVMVPEFRNGNYGAGLLAGLSRIASRIAERRNVTLEGAPPPDDNSEDEVGFGGAGFLVLIAIIILLNMIGRTAAPAALLGRSAVERLEQRRRAVRRRPRRTWRWVRRRIWRFRRRRWWVRRVRRRTQRWRRWWRLVVRTYVRSVRLQADLLS